MNLLSVAKTFATEDMALMEEMESLSGGSANTPLSHFERLTT